MEWDNRHDRFVEPRKQKRQSTRATRSRQRVYDKKFDTYVFRGEKEWGIEYHPMEVAGEISWPEPSPAPPNRFYQAEEVVDHYVSIGEHSAQLLMFFPYEFRRDLPSTVLTVDEIRENRTLDNFRVLTKPVRIVQFTLFGDPLLTEERVTILTRDKLIAAIGTITIVESDWDKVMAELRGEEVIKIATPSNKPRQKCRLHYDCKGHFGETSFRDNLR